MEVICSEREAKQFFLFVFFQLSAVDMFGSHVLCCNNILLRATL